MIHDLAAESGFELAGVAPVGPVLDFSRYSDWAQRGNAGAMGYLTDGRADLRQDVRRLLASAQSVICVGKLYNGPEPNSTALNDSERGWIARYAWGDDYHGVLRAGLERLAHALERVYGRFDWKACVDTAPLLERSLAKEAGLGWIGKNTCLINQARGSWFFLGELITSLPLPPTESTAVDRCGTCSRCIEACPTSAIVASPQGRYEIDARLCISYLTIELRGSVDENLRGAMGNHVFGCDICQDVCPWNGRAGVSEEPRFQPRAFAPPLEKMAALTQAEFRALFRPTPVERTRYSGFLRNVAIAMGNSGSRKMIAPLELLAAGDDPTVSQHALWALRKLRPQIERSHHKPDPCIASHY